MIPLLMATLVLDGDGQGSGILGLTATVTNNHMLSLDFTLEVAHGTTPVVIWPRGSAPFSNTCLWDNCCLRNMSTAHRNDALGGSCQIDPALDYVTGSRPNVVRTGVGFTATLAKPYPAWVAVVFVGQQPPYLANVRTLAVVAPDTASFSVKVHNPTCTDVTVPGRPFQVCMYCDNTRPFNSEFVFTNDWFRDFQCSWECRQGYRETGLSCMPEMTLQMPSKTPWVVGVAVLLFLACIMTRQAEEEPEPVHTPAPTLVQFTSTVTHGQIRVKIN